MSRSPSSLSARTASCAYGSVVAVRDVSLDVPPGACVALVGESGSGKTTLLRCFNGLVSPTSGTVVVDDHDVRSMPQEQLRRGIGYVPQNGGLLPHWRVLRNVALVPSLLGRADALARARDAMDRVGLSSAHFAERFPHELSGGQRQRVALARAIAAEPGLLLLDEPFGALDAITRADVQAAFAELRASLGVTTLIVTHDLAEAALLADQIAVMRAGAIEQLGTIAELRQSPATPYVAELLGRALGAQRCLLETM